MCKYVYRCYIVIYTAVTFVLIRCLRTRRDTIGTNARRSTFRCRVLRRVSRTHSERQTTRRSVAKNLSMDRYYR